MSNMQRYDIELHNNENGKIGKFTLLYDKSLFSQDDIKAFVKQRQEIYTNYKDMLLYLMVTKNIICIPTEQVPLLDEFIQEKAEILKEENNKRDIESSFEVSKYDIDELVQAKDILERRTTIPGDGYFYEDIEIAYSFVEDLLDDLIKQNEKGNDDIER